ncbi:Coenzyme F420 hydrogenase/dehydrogenase, beta subunit C-terminal domain [uncultured Bacteroides sp.]|uniref:Coenzyme F420 hydrogenase/dehydrogenase, beta subunit C-terminal domain n=1 Tax=uncultured Bacteroides sp. TaxID=162156 RepID=UPI0025D97098|nr:Coenzyme F420 hydrogenase/dehydrogenase, beta subunit C-terminal domain [uncultured Bacteroides sp.]
MYFESLDKKDCSGCTACVNVCPKQCISMKQDEEGFYYPKIDKSFCIKCGLCEKVCPFDKPRYENVEVQDVYASYIKDVSQRQQSTSGGIFYVIAKWVIERGGIVYGAAFDDRFKLIHVGIETINDLDRLRGSKYLQSYLGTVFLEIKEHLKTERWVYFVGCGCQVAGLNAFLRKKYNTLITSDLVCHGVPSQLMFDWHLDYLRKKEKSEITSYSFRDLSGWGVCETYEFSSQTRGKGKRILPSYSLSPYLYSFMWAFNYRYSCYDCKFARVPRQGDITLGDYWGVAKFFPELDRTKGISLILVNTFQGISIWNSLKESVEYRKSKINDAACENANLVHKTEMPVIRTTCYKMICERGYADVARNEFRIKKYWRVKFLVYLSQTIFWKILSKLKHRIRKS